MCKKDWDVFRDVPFVNPYWSKITGVQSCSWRPNVRKSSDVTHPAWKFLVSSWGLLLFGSGVLNCPRNRISHPCLTYKNIFTLLLQLAEYENQNTGKDAFLKWEKHSWVQVKSRKENNRFLAIDCVMEIKWEFSVNNVFFFLSLSKYIQGAHWISTR